MDKHLGYWARSWLRAAVALLLAAGIAGCAQPPRTQQPSLPGAGRVTPSELPEHYWWRACFRMPFDEHNEPRWNLDLLLAEHLAAPALRRHAAQIPLWRFHRRAAKDALGHQFSLLFYSDRATAERLFAELQQDPLVPALIDRHYLSRLIAPCGDPQPRPQLEATSDPAWDIRLQRTWPHFIMGVSAQWLALIEEVGAQFPEESAAPDALLARYGRIQEEIDAIWREDGQHAYLHHLNALFGYQPLLIRY